MTDEEALLDRRQQCAHLHVEYGAEKTAEGYTRGWWECRNCGTRFVTESHMNWQLEAKDISILGYQHEVAALKEQLEELREALSYSHRKRTMEKP